MEKEAEDPRYIDYLKTTDKPSWIGYQNYCGELYEKLIKDQLEKYSQRNSDYLREINHLETFIWLQDYMKNAPKEMWRNEGNKTAFHAHLSITGSYNSLMMELSKDEMEKESIFYFLDKINNNKQLI